MDCIYYLWQEDHNRDLWIYGPAGARKSIARKFPDLCEPEKFLLAGFFFALSEPAPPVITL